MGNSTDYNAVHCQCDVMPTVLGAGMVAPEVEFTPIVYFQYFRDTELNFIPLIFTILFLLLGISLSVLAFFNDKRQALKVCGRFYRYSRLAFIKWDGVFVCLSFPNHLRNYWTDWYESLQAFSNHTGFKYSTQF